MKQTATNHFYSLLVAALFLILAAGSAKVNKIHCGAFNTTPTGEGKADRNYVEMKDGTIVSGDKVSWKSGLIFKDQIKIDDQKIPIKETRGYYYDGSYFGRLGNSYIQRIVHGKLNVYIRQVYATKTEQVNGMMRSDTRLECSHYVQVGDSGELVPIGNQSDIKEFVKDCPAAVAMIDKKGKDIRKAIRKNPSYLNEIFIMYNNGCK